VALLLFCQWVPTGSTSNSGTAPEAERREDQDTDCHPRRHVEPGGGAENAIGTAGFDARQN
jgi:hypothetical protein